MRNKNVKKIQNWLEEPIATTKIERICSIVLIVILLIICISIALQSSKNNVKEFHSGLELSNLVNELDQTVPAGYEEEIQDIKEEYDIIRNTEDSTASYDLTRKLCKQINDLLDKVNDNIDK